MIIGTKIKFDLFVLIKMTTGSSIEKTMNTTTKIVNIFAFFTLFTCTGPNSNLPEFKNEIPRMNKIMIANGKNIAKITITKPISIPKIANENIKVPVKNRITKSSKAIVKYFNPFCVNNSTW
jgi:hypothetical protein